MMPLGLALLANLWIYKILFANFFLGALVVLSTIFLKKNFNLLLLTFIPIFLFQIVTTQKSSLTEIANDDRRLIDLRLRAYPSKYLRVGHWLEERKESIAGTRIIRNLFENLDPNLYFFAGSPRQRVGIKEFEKFPYVFLPFFLIGFVTILDLKDKNKILFISLLIPLLLLSIIGNQNKLGPFSLFPFMVLTISSGLKKINKFLVVILVLVLAQMVIYETY